MHELSVTRDILNIVLRHGKKHGLAEIVRVNLEMNTLSDLKEQWLQQYFTRLARNTIAEDCRVSVSTIPLLCRCTQCGSVFCAESLTDEALQCSVCNTGHVTVISESTYTVKSIEGR